MTLRTSPYQRRRNLSQAGAYGPIANLLAVLAYVAAVPVVAAFSPLAPSVAWGVNNVGNRPSQIMSSVTGEPSAMSIKDNEDDPILSSMPWGDFQYWALRDNLHRYLVTIPSLGNSDSVGAESYETYALWRTMTQDVTELAGYEPKFLMAMHTRYMKQRDSEANAKTGVTEKEAAFPLASTPGVLPFLDQFEFTTEGGVSGRANGLPGIADGAAVTTSAVAEVESTVKQGYVRTEDGTVAYELGIPAGEFYSLDGTAGVVTEKARKAMLTALASTADSIAKGDVTAAGAGLTKAVASGDGDDMLIKLGGSTAILLAGATAMSMLSHHLTVNVFWV